MLENVFETESHLVVLVQFLREVDWLIFLQLLNEVEEYRASLKILVANLEWRNLSDVVFGCEHSKGYVVVDGLLMNQLENWFVVEVVQVKDLAISMLIDGHEGLYKVLGMHLPVRLSHKRAAERSGPDVAG